MQAINLNEIETMEIQSELDPTARVRVGFPISSTTGTAASASVYFELDPGCRLAVHTDSAEEFLIVLEGEGEGLVGEEIAPVKAGDVVVVPAMVRHGMTNTGTEVLRVFGTFAGSTNIGTFEEPFAEDGPQVFVVGGPMPIALPLEVPVQA